MTLREREVVRMVTRGLSNKEIADKLLITEKTVKFHLTNIYNELGVKSRAQLIVRELANQPTQEEIEALGL